MARPLPRGGWRQGLLLLARLADQCAQLLRIGLRLVLQPFGQGLLVAGFGQQPVAPLFDLVQQHGVGGASAALLLQGGAYAFDHRVVQPAHQLAHVLHLAAAAFKIANASGVGQGIQQDLRQLQPLQQTGAQPKQFLAQRLQFLTLALEVGLAELRIPLALTLEFTIQFAAFGHKMAAHIIATLWFAGHIQTNNKKWKKT